MEPIILSRISDQKPLVSVVSITYNHEPYIRDCLEGFLMQKTDFPFEVIIHDDASTDHTADIIREYYEKRPDLFHVIIERENQYSKGTEVSTPLIKMAQGKYIALCEGDDFWTDSLKLQKQFNFLEKKPDCSLCFHNVYIKTHDVKVYPLSFSSGYKTGKDVLKKWTIPTCSVLFRREVRDIFIPITEHEIRFYAGDIIVFLSAARIGHLYGLKDRMATYRRQPGGLTNKILGWKRRCEHYNALSEHFPEYRAQIQENVCSFLYLWLILSLLARNRVECKEILAELGKIKSVNAHAAGMFHCILRLPMKIIKTNRRRYKACMNVMNVKDVKQ